MQQGPYDPNQPGPSQGQQQGPQNWPQQNPPSQQGPQQWSQQPNQSQQYPPQQYYPPPRKGPSKMLILAVVAVVAIIIIAAVAVMFMSGGGDGGDGTETIGAQGGTVSIDDGDLDGLRIVVPTGALESDVDFTVTSEKVEELDCLPDDCTIAGRMITVETDGTSDWDKFKVFDKVLTVTMPYDDDMVDDEEGVRFYQYDPVNDHLEPTGFLSQNKADNTITFNVATFSKFIAVEIAMTLLESAGSSLTVDTGFTPAADGWSIPNYGSYLKSGGLCLGMTSYAKWYYTYQKDTAGEGLYTKYQQGNPSEWRDDATAIELATRVQMGVQGIWTSMTAEERTSYNTRDCGMSIIHGMLVSGEPQLIGLKTVYNNGNFAQGGHAILAYKYEGGRFYTYDPNNPGEATAQQQIPFNLTAGFTQNYKSGLNAANPLVFNVFYHSSAKVFTPNNAFTGLYNSAEDDFDDDSIFPNIELTDTTTAVVGLTPVDTDTDGIRDTTESKCKITGTITGGQQAVTKTLVCIGNERYQASLSDGEFEVEVPLKQGTNDVVVLATDANTFTNWAGYYHTEIESTAARSALTVTMTWGQGDSDVDLHVLEPEGRHIYYSNRGTSDTNSAYLDFDNVYGYGPEHYYATEDNVLYDASHVAQSDDIYGTYQIAVHYFADKDSDTENYQTMTWTVTVSYLVIYIEATGVEIWEEATYTGFLSTPGGSGSAHSFASGTGWSEIMTFECEEPDMSDYTIPDPEDVSFS